MRFFRAIKASEVNVLLATPNASSKRSRGFVKSYALEASLVFLVAAEISAVLAAGSLAEIAPSVVSRDGIPMVDLNDRPPACRVQPSKSVSVIKLVVNSNLPIAAGEWSACKLTSRRVPSRYAPPELSCFRIVGKKFAQARRSQ